MQVAFHFLPVLAMLQCTASDIHLCAFGRWKGWIKDNLYLKFAMGCRFFSRKAVYVSTHDVSAHFHILSPALANCQGCNIFLSSVTFIFHFLDHFLWLGTLQTFIFPLYFSQTCLFMFFAHLSIGIAHLFFVLICKSCLYRETNTFSSLLLVSLNIFSPTAPWDVFGF